MSEFGGLWNTKITQHTLKVSSVYWRDNVSQIQTHKLRFRKECLFIMTQTTWCKFSGNSPSSGHKTTVTETSVKRLKTRENDMRSEVTYLLLFWVLAAVGRMFLLNWSVFHVSCHDSPQAFIQLQFSCHCSLFLTVSLFRRRLVAWTRGFSWKIAGTASLCPSVITAWLSVRTAFRGIVYVFGSYFRTLVILVSDFVSFLRLQSLIWRVFFFFKCIMPSSGVIIHLNRPAATGHRRSSLIHFTSVSYNFSLFQFNRFRTPAVILV